MTRLRAALGVALVGGALTIPASDTFTRADGPLGGNWVSQFANGMQIATNEIEASAGNSSAPDTECMRWNPATDTFSANQSSQVTLANQPTDQVNGVTVRASGTNGAGTFAAYLLNIRGIFTGNTDIAAIVSGVGYAVILDLPAVTWTTGDTARLEVTGTTVTAYQNGVSIGTVTDSSLATGQPGVCVYAYPFGARMDNWVGDNLGGGTPPATTGKFLLLGVGHHP